MTRADLCRITGLTSGHLTPYIKDPNRDPRLSTLIKIADALDVTLDCLAGREETKAPILYKDAAQEKLNKVYKDLNKEGQKKIVDYACDIADNDRYSVKSEVQDNKVSNVA